MHDSTRLTRPQRAALLAATYHRDGLVYVGSIHPRTLAALIRAGLMELVREYNGQPSVARITAAGRARGGAR